METSQNHPDSAKAPNWSEEKFAQFKEDRLKELGVVDEELAVTVADIVLHAKEPLLVKPEDLSVGKEHVTEHMRNLVRMYAPLINSTLDHTHVSNELAKARIHADFAEQDMLQFRESEEGSRAAQMYDDATIAEMYGKMAIAKNFLKNNPLLRGSGWRGQEAYKQKVELWAEALMEYQYWVNIAEKVIEKNKYWGSEEGKRRAAELTTTNKRRKPEVGRGSDWPLDYPNDIVSQGLIGQGPLKDFFGQ